MDFSAIYKDKKVFLTGHTGFKGSWLNLWLKNLGAEVYGYALKPNTTPNHFELLGGSKEFQGIFADVRDRVQLKKSLQDFKPNIIFHLAAQPLVRESYKNPISTFEINTIGTLNILECARDLQNLKAIVVITTDKVYENKEWIWGYRENDTLGGYDPYSASKACAEIVIDSMRNSFFHLNDFNKSHNVLIASARAGNVIGGGDFSIDRIIPDLIKGIMQGRITNIRNPLATRPWQNVLEPLRGYLMLGARLLSGDKNYAQGFNFGPFIDGNLSVLQMLEISKSHWDRIQYKVNQDKSNPHEANLLMLDSTKAYHLLGWKPLLSPEQSIAKTITWYKNFIQDNIVATKDQLQEYIKAINSKGGGGNNSLLKSYSLKLNNFLLPHLFYILVFLIKLDFRNRKLFLVRYSSDFWLIYSIEIYIFTTLATYLFLRHSFLSCFYRLLISTYFTHLNLNYTRQSCIKGYL